MSDAASFWDRQAIHSTHHNWLADPEVRNYVNRLIGGGEPVWPLDWFQRRYPRRFPVALSVGCGTGALERDIIRRGISERVDAFDMSEVSLSAAREAAASAGMSDRIAYRKDDFDRVALPRGYYDIVFFHQALHHVSRLERLLRHVRRSLKPDGLLYLDEYVGPSRTYWDERTVAWYRALFRLIPEHVRYQQELLVPVQWDDWTEALRSGEILSRLHIGFRIDAFAGYGGNLLGILFPQMIPGKVPESLVTRLIEAEKALLASGAPHFHAIMVAKPKRGTAALAATARYLIEPKIRRIRRELRLRYGTKLRYEPEEDVFRL